MDAELKRKWVKALRSGRYEQGAGALHDGKRYCCLGVLGKISGQLRPEGSWGDVWCMPPSSAQGLLPDKAFVGLADMNDAHVPFDVIAGFIEENL